MKKSEIERRLAAVEGIQVGIPGYRPKPADGDVVRRFKQEQLRPIKERQMQERLKADPEYHNRMLKEIVERDMQYFLGVDA